MSDYPEPVLAIANDYLERVRAQLRSVPALEQDDLVKEIQSHIYEAYLETPGGNDVARMLAVLRKIGEPAEAVADRLPATMLRSGSRRSVPIYIIGGLLVALFGIPIGAGGLGVLLGLLGGLASLLVGYFALAGSLVLVGALFMLLGLMRLATPHLLDNLIAAGIIQIPTIFLDYVSPADQGMVMLLFASIVGIAGLGLFWAGKRLFRGLRFLFTLFLDWTGRAARSARRKLRYRDPRPNTGATPVREVRRAPVAPPL
jgi:hypothetical protein